MCLKTMFHLVYIHSFIKEILLTSLQHAKLKKCNQDGYILCSDRILEKHTDTWTENCNIEGGKNGLI